MRTAIYARYSSDLQREASIDDQIRVCRERIEREGGTVVEIYADAAISGTRASNRPGLQKLMADAKEKRFDAVYAEALDRLSRDQEDVAGLFKRLRYADVRIVTLAEGEISELHVGLKGTMNALFIKDLGDKVRRGQRGRAEAKRAAGGISYGYDVVRNIGTDGEIERGVRKVNDFEAVVIRRIFAEYVAGVGPRKIAADLNREGVPSPRGGEWNASTINGHPVRLHGILTNPLYGGMMIYNRVGYRKDPETGKRQIRATPQEQWVRIPVPELRIVDPGIWDRAQAMRAELGGRKRPEYARRPKHLLSGLIRCGVCGGAYTMCSTERMACVTYRQRGTCANGRTVKLVDLTERVLVGLTDSLLAPDKFEAFAQEHRATHSQRTKDEARQIKALERERADIDRRIDRLVESIADGTANKPVVKVKLQEASERLEQVKAELAAIAAAPKTATLHPSLPNVYRDRVTRLKQALQGGTVERGQARQILRSLIDGIRVYPGKERGDVEIELFGAIVAILAFAQAQARNNDLATLVAVVPRVGIEPTTLQFSIACSTN
jgi:site-specific DNA recombinase